MLVGNITYRSLYNSVIAWITTNCTNIANFASISNVFKVGYSNSGSIPHSGGDAFIPKYTYNIIKYVPQVNSSTVSTDLTRFLNERGLTNLDIKIPESELIDYINNLASFCITKLAIATSHFAQSTNYLIYNSSSTSYYYTYAISTNLREKLVEASDANTIVTIMIDGVNKSIRNYACTYSLTFSS